MLFINAEEIREIFTMRDAIESDREAFVIQAEGLAEVPVRTGFDVYEGCSSLYMPAFIKSYPRTGLKIVSTYKKNAERNLPVVAGSVILLDPCTGFVNAILDGTELTKMRTGAVSGLATELLANEGAEVGAQFGAGGQGLSQLEGVLCARKLKEVRIYDLDSDRVKNFIAAAAPIAERYGARLKAAASSDEAIDNADVITCATTAAAPLFDGGRVKAGAHINGVGSYVPEKRELDETVVTRADRVFVDNMEAILAEAGDLLIPMNEGKFRKEDIAGELGELILGRVAGRTSKEQITVMKTVGFATLDIVIGHNVCKKAVEKGVGRKI